MRILIATFSAICIYGGITACRTSSEGNSATKDGVVSVGSRTSSTPTWNTGSETLPYAGIAYTAPQLDAICQSMGHEGWVLRSPVYVSDGRKSGYFAVPNIDGEMQQHYLDNTPMIQNISCQGTGDHAVAPNSKNPLERTFRDPKWGDEKTAVLFASAKQIGNSLTNLNELEMHAICQYLGYSKWAKCGNPNKCGTMKVMQGSAANGNYAVAQARDDDSVVIRAENMRVAPIKEIRCLRE